MWSSPDQVVFQTDRSVAIAQVVYFSATSLVQQEGDLGSSANPVKHSLGRDVLLKTRFKLPGDRETSRVNDHEWAIAVIIWLKNPRKYFKCSSRHFNTNCTFFSTLLKNYFQHCFSQWDLPKSDRHSVFPYNARRIRMTNCRWFGKWSCTLYAWYKVNVFHLQLCLIRLPPYMLSDAH